MNDNEIYEMLINYNNYNNNDYKKPDVYQCQHTYKVEDISSGDLICTDCGVILGEKKVDTGGEYMGQCSDKPVSMCRVNYNNNFGLLNSDISSTLISNWKDKNNLRRWHNCITLTSRDRSLLQNYNVIDQHSSNLGIDQYTTDLAKKIYKICSEYKITRGNIKKSLIGSCIYISCEYSKITRITIPVICKECKIDPKYISKTNKYVYTRIWDSHNTFKDVVLNTTSLDDHLFNYSSKLNITGDNLINLKKYTDNILKNHPDILNNINERSYIIIAILFIYLSVIKNKSVKKCDFCNTFNISQITLSKSVKIINAFITLE